MYTIKLSPTSQTSAILIQAQCDIAKARGARQVLIKVEVDSDDLNSITLNKGVELDPYHVVLDFGGATVLFTGDGAAFTQLSRNTNCFTQGLGGIQNVNLVCSVAGKPGTIGLDLKGVSPETRTSTVQHNVTIQRFEVGLRLGAYAYLNHFYGLIIDQCNTGLQVIDGPDAGENVTVHGGAISNGTLGIDVQSTTSELNLYGVSIDYNGRIARIQGGGRVSMFGGHLETSGVGCLSGQIVVSGNGGSFSMTDGYFLLADRGGIGPYSFTHMVATEHVNATIEFKRTRLHNHRNTSDVWAIGPGRVMVDSPTFMFAMMPRKAHPSQLVSFKPVVGFTYQEQALNTLSVVTTGDRVVITRGQVGSGFVQVGGFSIPVSADKRGRRLSLVVELEGNLGANCGLSLRWADGSTPTTWTTTVEQTFNAFVGVVTGPITVPLSSDLRVPSWATHLVVVCDVTGSTAGKFLAVTPRELGVW